MFELVYTSLPRGLLPGRSGFTTAAITAGMPANLLVPLENLSGYNFTYENGTLPPALNPVCCYYTKLHYGNQILSVVGRIAPCGLDYSQRNNKLAHHILLESPAELAVYAAGAAELLRTPGAFLHTFDQSPGELPFRKLPQCSQPDFTQSSGWQQYGGDCAYVNYIVRQFRQHPAGMLYIKYPAHLSEDMLLQLICEVAIVLTPEERDNFTFNTFYSDDRSSGTCFLRFMPAFSPQWTIVEQLHKNNIIDLTRPQALPHSDNAAMQTTPSPVPAVNVPDAPETDTSTGRRVHKSSPAQYHEQHLFPAESRFRTTASSILKQKPAEAIAKLPDQQPLHQLWRQRRNLFIAAVLLWIFSLTATAVWLLKSPEEIPIATPMPAPGITFSGQPSRPFEANIPSPSGNQVTRPEQYITAAMCGQAEKLPAEAALQLFLQYDKIKHHTTGQYSLDLPPQLHKTHALYARLAEVGGQRTHLESFVTNPRPDQLIFPAADPQQRPLQPYDQPIRQVSHLAIGLNHAADQLQIRFIHNTLQGIMPELQQISHLYFLHHRQLIYWASAFTPDYLPLIPPGKIELSPAGVPRYTASDTAVKLRNYVECRIGNCSAVNFNSMSFFFNDWNKTVKCYWAALNKLRETTRRVDAQTPVSSTQLPREEQMISLRKKWIQKLTGILTADKNAPTVGELQLWQQEVMLTLNSFFNSSSPFRYHGQYKQLTVLEQHLLPLLQQQSLREQTPLIKQHLEQIRQEIEQKIRAIHQFRTDKKQLWNAKKKLRDEKENLQHNAQRTLAAANRIHPDNAALLQRLMSMDNSNDCLDCPGTIDARDIELLVADISQRIKVQCIGSGQPDSQITGNKTMGN